MNFIDFNLYLSVNGKLEFIRVEKFPTIPPVGTIIEINNDGTYILYRVDEIYMKIGMNPYLIISEQHNRTPLIIP